MKQIELELLCELTDEEVQMRGLQLASAFVERDKVDAAKRDAARSFGKQLEGIDERMRRLADAIAERREYRFVRCAVIFHLPANGTKRITRADSGEIVREEPMTMAECQQFLFTDAQVDAESDAATVTEIAEVLDGSVLDQAAPRR
jgi:hypothetical protein